MRTADPGSSALTDISLADYGVIGGVAQWCECLNGKSPLLTGLEALGTGVQVEAIALVRHPRGAVTDGQAVIWDRAPADVRGGRLTRGFARSLLGPFFEASRSGSLWFRSLVEEFAPDLSEFHKLRNLRELAVIPLETGDRFVDTLELHFAEKVRNQDQLMLSSLAPVVSTTWRRRNKGLFVEALLQRTARRQDKEGTAAILSAENPAHLSRAEYRVSLMLSRGMVLDEIKSALGIQDSTLRTHLTSIYAKTQVSGLSELVFLLAAGASAPRVLSLDTRRRA